MRPARALLLLFVLLAAAAGCRATRGGGPAPALAGAPAPVLGSAASFDTLAGAPIVPILRDYRVLSHYRISPAQAFGERADYSGITIRSDRRDVQIWICEDKATAVGRAIFFTFIQVPRAPVPGLQELRPAPMPTLNPEGLRSGEDIEDLMWVPSDDPRIPAALVAVGEQGPDGAPESWRYRFDMLRDGLALREAGPAPAPPLEVTNNDGLEGVAARRLDDGRIEIYTCKERGGDLYVALDTLAADADPILMPGDWKPVTRRSVPRLLSIPEMSSQSGATCRSRPGPEILVIDRLKRRIAVIPLPPPHGPSAPRLDPRLWYDFTAVDSLLEGRTGDTPASLFGTCEGIAEDAKGRLYLLSDNNEANSSRLVILEPVEK